MTSVTITPVQKVAETVPPREWHCPGSDPEVGGAGMASLMCDNNCVLNVLARIESFEVYNSPLLKKTK